MGDDRFSAAQVLAGLKDFQLRTVDYVFDRFYRKRALKFLVADEVGLGKTLVARGLIARAIEHLQDKVKRVDVIYVCSNAAIAAQNVNRLNVSGEKGFAFTSRLTFLPLQVRDLAENSVNFISFTPGTTFDMKSRGGRVEERALIYKILRGADWDVGLGLLNLLQGGVRKRDNWLYWAKKWRPRIDDHLAQAFRTAIKRDSAFCDRLTNCCEHFRRHRKNVPGDQSSERDGLIGELRHRLAQICLHALEPDLVILDEFQRFKDLLDGDDNAAVLARALFDYPGVRTLMLSATPYKMLSMDHEQDDDHYPDFIRTLEFLFNGDTGAIDSLKRDIQLYRSQIFALADGGDTTVDDALLRLQSSLLRVMCRTERVGMTKRLDAMLIEPPRTATLHPDDLDHVAIVDRAARAVGAREPIEYWKSSPYLLNFLKHYELRRKIDAVLDAPPAELLDTLRQANGHVLGIDSFENYEEVPAANPRMRVLFADTIDKGLWRLLWMPPSLPYSEPSGPYAEVTNVTKALVFSSWNVVPDAIAAVCSYEAERRMVTGLDRSLKHSELYDRVKPLLRFTKGRDGRLTGMPAVVWLLPSAALAALVDPLELARTNVGSRSIESMLVEVEGRCTVLLQALPAGRPGNRADARWYWAALAMLDSRSVIDWCAAAEGWVAADAEHDPGARFRDHLENFVEAAGGELDLGPRPDDLARVLAELALAGPGVCALRSLRRVATSLEFDDHGLLSAAARVAGGFRTLFNLPETIALLRGAGEESYWRLSLQHALDGNIQALMDEQVHVLLEQLGLVEHDEVKRIDGISNSLAASLSLRTAQILVDELKPNGQAIALSSFNTRCRFALRFGDLRGDKEATIARAGTVREAFNSPFRPFILASTSIGQEGLDFHTWCHAVVHWNLPSNPVDLEQREGRVHRFKGHAVRKNIAERYGLAGLRDWNGSGDPWKFLFERARVERPEGSSDLIPYWVYEEGSARIERRVPLIPFSKEVGQLERLKRSLALYRLVFGQPRQEDLLTYLTDRMSLDEAEAATTRWRISLEPPRVIDED